ncbi:AfsR/SARP family transcriptional regulator [Streptosporangium carneum]|uniref:SARP family transcriptional regulator n=1 Tax=Streptosporangium carneum TaxID=47481 RepID=A0A9W6I7Q5_9ACTN|nr:BTAD domain-containing putative transcriptional regulator [Streptosporangium carneum]GLK12719.1 SARP family transcriptional regulator [Streptosporangium carneum]
MEIVTAEGTISAGPPQRCAVLASLAVNAGRPVTVETLIDRIWEDRPPEHVRRALHAHVARIRRLLEQTGGPAGPSARLVRRSGGYLLEVAPERVDVHRFRHLLQAARAPKLPDVERVTLLREALGLWQGEPLGGLTGQWAARTRQSWRQQYLDAVTAWARAELRVENAAAVIGPLTDLVGENPLLEPLVAVLMRALYTVGRSTQAVDLYSVTRRRLVEELGAEASAELRRVHQAILRDDLDGQRPAVTPPHPRPASVALAQLPRDIRGFSGRNAELARLHAALPASDEQAATVVVSALAGTAGVGKTALAVHWAHQVRHRFPDGQLYVNLRGFDPSGSMMDPAEALRGFLDALQVTPQRIPIGVDAQSALYRSLLAGRRILIVLDNARNADQVRPLLPGAPGCLALVTSRNQLAGLVADGALPLTLDLLTPVEARELLTLRLGADRIADEPQAVEEIISRCAHLPLALAVVAARAAAHLRFPLHALATELGDVQNRLDVLTGGDAATDVRAVLSWSYRTLAPQAALLFRLLALHPGPDISASATASLAGLPRRQVQSLLAELTRANLIVEHVPGRYAFHDLLRAYAAEQAHATDTDQQRRAAIHRTLDHYLHTAYAAALLLHACRDAIPLAPLGAGVTPERLPDHRQALTWFTTEHAVLLAAVEHASDAGFDTHTWQLAWTLTDFLDRQGHWHDWIAAQRAAVTSGRRLSDPATEAGAHQQSGHAHIQLGRFDEARAHLQDALALFRLAGEKPGQAQTHYSFAVLSERQGRHTEALHHARRCLELFDAADHRHGKALALSTLGWLQAQLGDHRRALTNCQRSLALFQEIGDLHGQGETLDRLGYVHHHLGHHIQAVACYRQALELLGELRDRYWEARILTHLGDTHHSAGVPSAARDAWRKAVDILDDLGLPGADGVRAKLAALEGLSAPASPPDPPGRRKTP